MNLQEINSIISKINNKVYSPIYFLMGEETYYIDLINDLLENKVLSEDEKSFNQTILYGKDTSCEEIISVCKRFPMMSKFQSPSEIKTLSELDKKKIRVGGMVKKDSILVKANEVKFIITDFKNEINVTYTGAIPNLFEEGKGVVAEGFLKDRNFFSAIKILAKHDENYMPPEVKQALGEK